MIYNLYVRYVYSHAERFCTNHHYRFVVFETVISSPFLRWIQVPIVTFYRIRYLSLILDSLLDANNVLRVRRINYCF